MVRPGDRRITAACEPSTAQAQAEIPMAGEREIDDAVAAAQSAAGAWRDMTPLARRGLLTGPAWLVGERSEQLATILMLETGLPLSVTLTSSLTTAASPKPGRTCTSGSLEP